MRVFDLHADTMMDIVNRYELGEKDVLNRRHLPHYRQGEVGALIYALWTTNTFGEFEEYLQNYDCSAPQLMIQMLSRTFQEVRATEGVEIATTAADIERIYESGKVALLLGLEGVYGFEGELGMVDVMYDLGFRHAMFTWNDDNEFAAGNEFSEEDYGLTELGVQAVKRMEELGMLIDVSHGSEKTFWDIMNNTTGPIMASHSNAWELCPCPRNLKDDQLRAIAERDGVIGMNSWRGFILPNDQRANVDDLATHARYIADLIGVEHVGCGFDYANYFDDDDALLPGLAHAGESQGFVQALNRAGFSDSEIQAICWDNAIRVVKAVLG
jgi:membrane dipeptidase